MNAYVKRIYVTHNRGHDLNAAKEFSSEIVYITDGLINLFNIDALRDAVADKLQDYTDEDALLICGSPIVNMMVVYVLMEKGFHDFRTLIFHAVTRRYVLRRFRGSVCSR